MSNNLGNDVAWKTLEMKIEETTILGSIIIVAVCCKQNEMEKNVQSPALKAVTRQKSEMVSHLRRVKPADKKYAQFLNMYTGLVCEIVYHLQRVNCMNIFRNLN